MLKQSGTVRANARMQERAMDTNDLERERGITILAKCTSVDWKGVKVNIVDTPGHADFAARSKRILSMVDGVVRSSTRRRSAPANQIRAVQGARSWHASDRDRQQNRFAADAAR